MSLFPDYRDRGHPVLNTISQYYFTKQGKHVMPLLVLLMSQATYTSPVKQSALGIQQIDTGMSSPDYNFSSIFRYGIGKSITRAKKTGRDYRNDSYSFSVT